jgi:hypothetical protein
MLQTSFQAGSEIELMKAVMLLASAHIIELVAHT